MLPLGKPQPALGRRKKGKFISSLSAPLTTAHSGYCCVATLPPPHKVLPPRIRAHILRTPPTTWADISAWPQEEALSLEGQGPAPQKSCHPCPEQMGRGKEVGRG